MKKTHKTILLMAIGAVLMFMAVSCGVNEEASEGYSAKDFLFISIDPDVTWFSFGMLSACVGFYWFARYLVMRDLREEDPSISYLEAEDYIMHYADSEIDKMEEEKNESTIARFFIYSLRGFPYLCRVTPVMMFYSWFFYWDNLPYWIFTVLTCLAIRFVPRWLGLDLSRFYNKWIVNWSIFSLVVFVIALIVVNKEEV